MRVAGRRVGNRRQHEPPHDAGGGPWRFLSWLHVPCPLQAWHAELLDALAQSAFGRPIVLHSSASADEPAGVVDADR